MWEADEGGEEDQGDVRPLSAMWSRSNGIRQSPTLSCHLLEIRRITCSTAKPDRPAGPASKAQNLSKACRHAVKSPLAPLRKSAFGYKI